MAKKNLKKKEVRKYTDEEIKTACAGYLTLMNENAAIRLMMEHYTFVEMKYEDLNPFFEICKADIDSVENMIDALYNSPEVNIKELEEKIVSLRRRIIRYAETITNYADRFAIYEYVLNRLEYNFIDYESLKEDDIIKDSVGYIFETDDNMVVNTRLLSIIGQLPIRMTKNRLCDLIADGAGVYKGSEKTSFNAFMDGLREVSGLKEIPKDNEDFDKFEDELKIFEETKFEDVDKAKYDELQARLTRVSNELVGLSDMYTSLMGLINSLYINILCAPYAIAIGGDNPAVTGIRATSAIYRDVDSDVFEILKPASDSYDDRLDSINPLFYEIMGTQETNSQKAQMMYSALDNMATMQRGEMENDMGDDIVKTIDFVTKLASSSDFMYLDENTVINLGNHKANENIVDTELQADAEYIREVTGEFNYHLKERLKALDRPVRRAVMSACIEKLPIFFREGKEVAEYISDGLKYCDDENEKQACMNAISMIIEEGRSFANNIENSPFSM
ncbi:MAG: hypothetical protein K6D02_07245 [Lachnospiraceae bacterium]|nr:hypothetical protein [Lachnospiraceae bacterium]